VEFPLSGREVLENGEAILDFMLQANHAATQDSTVYFSVRHACIIIWTRFPDKHVNVILFLSCVLHCRGSVILRGLISLIIWGEEQNLRITTKPKKEQER
jgi:hypothetical protein